MGIAALFFAGAQFDLARFNPAILATWVVLGIGALAVMGGLAGALLPPKVVALSKGRELWRGHSGTIMDG